MRPLSLKPSQMMSRPGSYAEKAKHWRKQRAPHLEVGKNTENALSLEGTTGADCVIERPKMQNHILMEDAFVGVAVVFRQP
ncbi:hypothetical protein CSR02_03655 [Acetobacter pomorum]|uniref:Uncharacterized protein n=1 Tax=Acetobacter pomorum TaxID=65959 RepID=A0A2G4RGV0_9PROT|nr:hypothetical protein CSR02_03655 [Acetobacter pomorum]